MIPLVRHPLATTVSAITPRSAVIIFRSTIDASVQPTYDLKIGDSILKAVSLDELLDFVSPVELEAFENLAFRREIDQKNALAQARHAAKQRSRRVSRQTSGLAPSDSSTSGDGERVMLSSADEGRNGPLDSGTNSGVEGRYGRSRPSYAHLYKRRGQGRGTTVDQAGPSRDAARRQQQATDELIGDASVLTLFDQPKRRRLGSGTQGYSRSATSTTTWLSAAPDGLTQGKPAVLVDLPSPLAISSDGSSVVSSSDSHAGDVTVTLPRPATSTPSTSIAASTAATDPETALPAKENELWAEASSVADSEDTYEIERIVEHRMSNPRTHPAEFGADAVMLYHVKWAGYDEPTWEPASSFDDAMVLDAYWAAVERKERSASSDNGSGIRKGKGRGRV